MPKDICIVGILVEDRASHAPDVQQVLTRFGSQIISRSGIPDPSRKRGIITLTMETDNSGAETLVSDLNQLCGVSAKSFCLVEALQ